MDILLAKSDEFSHHFEWHFVTIEALRDGIEAFSVQDFSALL
jgi:hypothetical protein